MTVYLVSFTLSVLLIAYGQKKRPSAFWSISALALLIPCLVAGLRAQTVGTDVMVYVKPMTAAAIQAENLKEFFTGYWFAQWRNLYVQNYEVGFSLLVYGVANLTHSLKAVLFVIQACMVVPVYIALARNRKSIPLWLGMAIYYLLFFNATLNMMRQWIAMAFLLLAFQMLRERKLFACLVLIGISVLFHNTAIVAIPIFLLFWVLWLVRYSRFQHNNLTLQGSSVVTGLLVIVAMAAIMNLPLLMKLLSMVGLGAYNSYLSGEGVTLMLGQIVIRLPLVFVLFASWKQMCRTDAATPFYMAMVLLDLVVSQLVSVDDNALRIGAYLSVYAILWVPSAYRTWNNRTKRVLLTILVLCYSLFYWYYTFVLSGRHSTYPYAFAPF